MKSLSRERPQLAPLRLALSKLKLQLHFKWVAQVSLLRPGLCRPSGTAPVAVVLASLLKILTWMK
jgi:hypothetical protein